MRFSRKIFIAVFSATFVLGSCLIWAAYVWVSKQTKQEFVSRYSVFSKVMGDALTHLDSNTEALMLNAAKVVAEKEFHHGLLSTDALKSLRDELSVTHLFLIDHNGKYLRSTNEDPSLIPNSYSFCPTYRKMISGGSDVEATPIIHPQPEPKPYKFLYIPSRDRKRLIEVGLRIDFVAKTLTEALGADSNLLSMSMYSPVGDAFARFSSKDVQFRNEIVQLPISFPSVMESVGTFKIFTKVLSSHPQCCQCDITKTSKAGEYYYVLESEISKKELTATLATAAGSFSVLALLNLIFAYALSRFISRRLVRNIQFAVARVRSIKESGRLDKRINLKGKDEVAFLTREFDILLDSREEAHRKKLEIEAIHTKIQVAREVAHNIKSPVLAVEIIMPMLVGVPASVRKVIQNSVQEIKALVDRLSRQADSLSDVISDDSKLREPVEVGGFLEAVVHEKQIEHSTDPKVQISLLAPEGSKGLVVVNRAEFRAVISNIINNSVESYADSKGKVMVSYKFGSNQCTIVVEDEGVGISQDLLPFLGNRSISRGKVNGRGIGLTHAFRMIAIWGGHISIDSSLKKGTKLSIILPAQFDEVRKEPVSESATKTSGMHP